MKFYGPSLLFLDLITKSHKEVFEIISQTIESNINYMIAFNLYKKVIEKFPDIDNRLLSGHITSDTDYEIKNISPLFVTLSDFDQKQVIASWVDNKKQVLLDARNTRNEELTTSISKIKISKAAGIICYKEDLQALRKYQFIKVVYILSKDEIEESLEKNADYLIMDISVEKIEKIIAEIKRVELRIHKFRGV